MKGTEASMLVLSGLAALAGARELQIDDVPIECATICGPIVELTFKCDVDNSFDELRRSKRRRVDNLYNKREAAPAGGVVPRRHHRRPNIVNNEEVGATPATPPTDQQPAQDASPVFIATLPFAAPAPDPQLSTPDPQATPSSPPVQATEAPPAQVQPLPSPDPNQVQPPSAPPAQQPTFPPPIVPIFTQPTSTVTLSVAAPSVPPIPQISIPPVPQLPLPSFLPIVIVPPSSSSQSSRPQPPAQQSPPTQPQQPAAQQQPPPRPPPQQQQPPPPQPQSSSSSYRPPSQAQPSQMMGPLPAVSQPPQASMSAVPAVAPDGKRPEQTAQEDKENAEKSCICDNKSFDVQLLAGMCQSCIRKSGNQANDMDFIMKQCNFSEAKYTPDKDNLVYNIRVVAQKPLLSHSANAMGDAGRIGPGCAAVALAVSLVAGMALLL